MLVMRRLYLNKYVETLGKPCAHTKEGGKGFFVSRELPIFVVVK